MQTVVSFFVCFLFFQTCELVTTPWLFLCLYKVHVHTLLVTHAVSAQAPLSPFLPGTENTANLVFWDPKWFQKGAKNETTFGTPLFRMSEVQLKRL